MPGAVAQHRGHWRQQHGRFVEFQARIGDAEIIDPTDLWEQPENLPERIADADKQHAHDQPVQPGIGHEGRENLRIEYRHQEHDEDQEYDHAPEKYLGSGEAYMSWFRCHERHFTFCPAKTLGPELIISHHCEPSKKKPLMTKT